MIFNHNNKILEVIFGIPNYRYKIWLFRLIIANILCFMVIYPLAMFTNWGMVDLPPLEMSAQVMVPTIFASTLSFMLSTMIRSGNGSAVVVIIIGLLLFFLNVMLGNSPWNVFLNPFGMNPNSNPEIFQSLVIDNRIRIIIASIVFLLVGLVKLEKRERFI